MATERERKLERWAHRAMGFGARLVYCDWLLYEREFVKQYPPGWPFVTTSDPKHPGRPTLVTQMERVDDMISDLSDYMVGAYCAELVRWASIAGLLVWLVFR